MRALEIAISLEEILPRPIVGLTEATLACGMILLLILRPRSIFTHAELGALLLAGRSRDTSATH